MLYREHNRLSLAWVQAFPKFLHLFLVVQPPRQPGH